MSTQKKRISNPFLNSDQYSIEHSLTNHLMYTDGKSAQAATGRDWYDAAAIPCEIT